MKVSSSITWCPAWVLLLANPQLSKTPVSLLPLRSDPFFQAWTRSNTEKKTETNEHTENTPCNLGSTLRSYRQGMTRQGKQTREKMRENERRESEMEQRYEQSDIKGDKGRREATSWQDVWYVWWCVMKVSDSELCHSCCLCWACGSSLNLHAQDTKNKLQSAAIGKDWTYLCWNCRHELAQACTSQTNMTKSINANRSHKCSNSLSVHDKWRWHKLALSGALLLQKLPVMSVREHWSCKTGYSKSINPACFTALSSFWLSPVVSHNIEQVWVRFEVMKLSNFPPSTLSKRLLLLRFLLLCQLTLKKNITGPLGLRGNWRAYVLRSSPAQHVPSSLSPRRGQQKLMQKLKR